MNYFSLKDQLKRDLNSLANELLETMNYPSTCQISIKTDENEDIISISAKWEIPQDEVTKPELTTITTTYDPRRQ